jgi:hypothetical protein
VSNFLTESGTVNGQQFVFATLGTATGDLRGGLGVYIFSITPGPNRGRSSSKKHDTEEAWQTPGSKRLT